MVPVASVSFAWASLETAPDWGTIAALVMVATLVAGPQGPRSRAALVAGAFVVTLLLAGSSPRSLTGLLDHGLRDVYVLVVPFDRAAHPELGALVLLAAWSFGVVIAVTARRRPFVATVATVIGVSWPASLLPARNTVAMGAVALLAALWPFAVAASPSRHSLVRGASVLAGLVILAAMAASAGARPATPALAWEGWDPFGASRASKTVTLVWTSNYGGIDFPAHPTTMLRIEAPRRSLYWRATTLDGFAGDRWIETLYGTAAGAGGGALPPDDLLPPAAGARRNWVEQKVEVGALIDEHVVAASQTVRLDAGAGRRVFFHNGGIIKIAGPPGQLRRYTVWSYSPRPTPADLRRSRPTYPPGLARYLDLGRAVAPAFGSPRRTATLARLFRSQLYQQLWPYEFTWREAERLTARAHSPYEATIAIERWLRSTGGFIYDTHPPAPAGLPPLADFVERTKRGYCQQFAGAMALMLRTLGIPSRVAVGFTSGTWKAGTWTVTDRDAHAWVEVWFAGYGWLTFDPTPGRGTLSATYTNASDSAEAIRALGGGRSLGVGARRPTPERGSPQPTLEGRSHSTAIWWLVVPIVLAGFAALGLQLAKRIDRRRSHARADARGRASFARAELVAFVRDQGSTIGRSASVDELAAELRRLGVASDAFAAAFARARYGPPARAMRAADDTELELRRVLGLLRARLGPGRRWRGFFAVRSLRRG